MKRARMDAKATISGFKIAKMKKETGRAWQNCALN